MWGETVTGTLSVCFKVEAVNCRYYHSNAQPQRGGGKKCVSRPHGTVLIRSHPINAVVTATICIASNLRLFEGQYIKNIYQIIVHTLYWQKRKGLPNFKNEVFDRFNPLILVMYSVSLKI